MHFVRRIQESEVREALKRMKRENDGPRWYPNQGVEMSQDIATRCGDVSGYSYSTANKDVQQYLSIEQDA